MCGRKKQRVFIVCSKCGKIKVMDKWMFLDFDIVKFAKLTDDFIIKAICPDCKTEVNKFLSNHIHSHFL